MTIEGPATGPGTYQVTLTVGEQHFTESFEVVCDPAAPASTEDLQAQFSLLMQIHHKTDEVTIAINRMRDLRQQLDGWRKRAANLPNGKRISDAAATLHEEVLEIEKTLQVPDLRPGWADSLNVGVRLLEQIIALPSVVALGNYRPTNAAYAVFEHLSTKIDVQLDRLGRLIEGDVPFFNALVAAAQFGALVPSTGRTVTDTTDAETAAQYPSTGVSGMEGGEGQPPTSGVPVVDE
jgi:hypothetical protein